MPAGNSDRRINKRSLPPEPMRTTRGQSEAVSQQQGSASLSSDLSEIKSWAGVCWNWDCHVSHTHKSDMSNIYTRRNIKYKMFYLLLWFIFKVLFVCEYETVSACSVMQVIWSEAHIQPLCFYCWGSMTMMSADRRMWADMSGGFSTLIKICIVIYVSNFNCSS